MSEAERTILLVAEEPPPARRSRLLVNVDPRVAGAVYPGDLSCDTPPLGRRRAGFEFPEERLGVGGDDEVFGVRGELTSGAQTEGDCLNFGSHTRQCEAACPRRAVSRLACSDEAAPSAARRIVGDRSVSRENQGSCILSLNLV